MSGFSRFLWWLVALMALAGRSVQALSAQGPTRFNKIGVEIKWNWKSEPLHFGSAQDKKYGLVVTRVDFLMSNLALRRADGTWLETGGWFACFKGADGMSRAVLEGVPSQVYTGLRFQVGVGAKENHQDPNRWSAGHALHPLVNGLHWGWQGGYIFMALEGHRRQADGTPGGFSYHLANDANLMSVALEGELDLTRAGTIGVELDVAKILGGLDPAEFGESTHSREGDPRAAALRTRTELAFSLTGVASEVWQDPAVAQVAVPAPSQGTPFPLRISSRFPQVKLPADNRPTLEGVELGRELFHETRLSVNNTQSCASCHDRSGAFFRSGEAA